MSTTQKGAFPYEFIQAGEGPVMLFLHGLFGEPANWQVSLRALAATHRAIALKFPFFSEPRLSGIQALSEYTLAFLEDQGVGRFSLCGNSLGGQVALDLCLKQPRRVDKLVLTGSAGLWEAQSNGNPPRATREFVREQARRIFYDPGLVDEELVEQVYRRLLDRSCARALLRLAKDAQRYTLLNQLEHIGVPTLLLWGQDDQITPPTVARRFHEKLPRARLTFFPRCGHAPPLEHPHRFAQAVWAFLTEAPPADPTSGSWRQPSAPR